MPGTVAIAAFAGTDEVAAGCAAHGKASAHNDNASIEAMTICGFTKGFPGENAKKEPASASGRRAPDRFDRAADDRIDAELSECCARAARIAVDAMCGIEVSPRGKLARADELRIDRERE